MSESKKKATDLHEEKIVPQSLKRVQSEDFDFVYANNCNVMASELDVRLLFGQIIATPDQEPFILDVTSVTVTWDHLKRLRDAIDRVMEAHASHISSSPSNPEDTTATKS